MTVFVKRPLTLQKIAKSFGVKAPQLVEDLQNINIYLTAEDSIDDEIAKKLAEIHKVSLVLLG